MGGLTYEPPLDKGGYARHLSPDRRPYKTSDGYICVIVYNDKQWQNFFDATGRDDLRVKGATILGTGEPRLGAHGVPVIFLHPRDMGGVLIELMAEPEH